MAGGVTLGFDLGGTQVRAALVQGGVILRRAAKATDVAGGPVAVMGQLKSLAEVVRGDAPVTAVGLAMPGPMDTVSGIVDNIPSIPGWDHYPVRERLEAALGMPVVVENDGIAAVAGEWKHGAGRGLRHLVYVTVSTGVGGGVVVDGNLLHGRRGMAGHIGHLRVTDTGPICGCGRVGCIEALASGTALGQKAAARAKTDRVGFLGRVAAEGPVEARHVTEGARMGDPLCLDLMDEEARLLGTVFSSLAHLFSPERIIIGGGVGRAFDLMRDRLQATYVSQAMPAFRDIEIVPAALGDNAGLIGVADLALARG